MRVASNSVLVVVGVVVVGSVSASSCGETGALRDAELGEECSGTPATCTERSCEAEPADDGCVDGLVCAHADGFAHGGGEGGRPPICQHEPGARLPDERCDEDADCVSGVCIFGSYLCGEDECADGCAAGEVCVDIEDRFACTRRTCVVPVDEGGVCANDVEFSCSVVLPCRDGLTCNGQSCVAE